MKSSEFITEKVAVLKPLAPKKAPKPSKTLASEDLSRRGFLKGAGVTAVGAAGLAGAKKAKADPRTFDDRELRAIYAFLTLYYFLKILTKQAGRKDNEMPYYQEIQDAIYRFSYYAANGRDFLNRAYSDNKGRLEDLKIKNPQQYQNIAVNITANTAEITKIIEDFKSLTEF
jgi:hypothetical protein